METTKQTEYQHGDKIVTIGEPKLPSEMTLQEFNDLVNQPPNPEHIKTSDEGYKHIPIAYLEADLRYCFEGRVEFQKTPTRQLFNAVDCDAIIKVWHPVLNVYQEFYGTGTVLIETVTQGKYADTTTVVKSKDESMATGMAYAEGKKSAARQIGRRFGSDLNRDNAPGKVSAYDKVANEEPYVFNPDGKHTKKDLLQLVTAGKITVEVMNEYLNNRK